MRTRGFTLIEVLAAFAVLAIGVAVVAGMLNGGRHQVRYAADLSYAAQMAQSVLDSQGLTARLHEDEDEGQSPDGSVRWHLDVHEIADPLADKDLIDQLQESASAELVARLEADGQTSADATTPAQTTGFDRIDLTADHIDPQSPWQLMQLVLDLEWGEGRRDRASFASIRVQIRAPDELAAPSPRANQGAPAARPETSNPEAGRK